MAYKVQITISRPNTGVAWAPIAESDVGIVPNLVASNGGSVTHTRENELVTRSVYDFPDQASWQAFYNAALPIWNRNSLVEQANNSGIIIDVSLLENT